MLKADIRTRAQTARTDAKSRHAKEKATLAFARIMIFHKTPPIPSLDEEVLIDKKLRELVDLSWQFKSVSRSDVSSAQHAITTANQLSSVDNKTCGDDHIFKITLQAIRVVHVRRIVAKISGDCIELSTTDPYKILLDKFPKSHLRRPFILLDQLVAMLTASYQVRGQKYNCESMSKLDEQALQRAKDFIETAKSFFEKSASTIKGTRDTDTTLFVTSARSLSDHLYQEALTHFSRTVSLYHSTKEWALCAHWSDMLQIIFQFNHQANTTVSLENSDVLLGQVMTVKAFAQSSSGDSANGVCT